MTLNDLQSKILYQTGKLHNFLWHLALLGAEIIVGRSTTPSLLPTNKDPEGGLILRVKTKSIEFYKNKIMLQEGIYWSDGRKN